MALAIIVLIVFLTLAYFHLKCSIMSSFSTLFASILGMILAFNWYEKAADLFISRGYGVNWAQFGCFLLLFLLLFAVIRALSEFLIGANIDLGKSVKLAVALSCGFLTGLIFSGVVLVAMGMLPMQGKVFYSRFDPEKTVSLNNPKSPLLNADGFVCGLYKLISAGSMSSGKSFGVVHADFLNQIHLNRLKIKEDVLAVNAGNSLVLASGNPVRLWNFPDGGDMTVVRMGIKVQSIANGGAGNAAGEVQFIPAQIRMVCKPESAAEGKKELSGTARAVLPAGFLEYGRLVKKNLEEIIAPDIKGLKDRILWQDVVFDIPQGQKGILLQFKQCAMVELPRAVPTSEDVEKALNQPEGQGNSSPEAGN